jgi:hypothetical protein
MRRKWIIVIIIASIFSGGLGYFSYIEKEQTKHLQEQTKYLREGISYEKMTNYEKAVKSYEQHLLNHPNDIIAKYRYAIVWRKLNNEDKCINVLCKIASEIIDLEFKYDEKYKLISNEAWNKLLEELITTATNEMLDKSIVQSYRMDVKEILSSEYRRIFSKSMADYKWTDLYELNNKRKEQVYDNSLEYKVARAFDELAYIQSSLALILWVEGKNNACLDLLESYPSDSIGAFTYPKTPVTSVEVPSQIITFFDYDINLVDHNEWWRKFHKINSVSKWKQKKYALCADGLSSLASDRFDKKKFKEAREAWADFVEYHIKAGHEKSSPLVAETMYNIAITYWNEEDFSSTIDAILIIQKTSPEYNKEKVAKKLVDAKYFNQNRQKGEYHVLSPKDKYQILPPEELKKLDGKGSITDYGWFETDIYNGSTWTVNELTIMITVTNKHSNAVELSRKYKPSLKQYYNGWPLTSSKYHEGLGFELNENQKWNWNIVEARGAKGKTPDPRFSAMTPAQRDFWSELQKGHSQVRVESGAGKPDLIEKKEAGQEVWIYYINSNGRRIITFKDGVIEKIEVKY